MKTIIHNFTTQTLCSPCALCHQGSSSQSGIDSTRTLGMFCGVWHQNIGSRSCRCCRLQGEVSVDWTSFSGASHGKARCARLGSLPARPHVQWALVRRVFWCLSFVTRIDFFGKLSYTSFPVASDKKSRPLGSVALAPKRWTFQYTCSSVYKLP